ncbi:MAG: DNA polymerase III subunit beta [Candidatus Sumerlaeota bacterium]|nr:DNA polymerase III subunit beta [Candidatus Sumerlaeota bacterium]
MKIVIKKADLLRATLAVHNIVNAQNSAPILSTILIRTEESGAIFMASDSESCVRCKIEAQIETEGAVTVPAREFAALVKELPETDITIAMDEQGAVVIECSSVNYRLTMMDPEKFPEWPYIESQTTFVLPQKGLRRAIESVIFAIPVRDPRKVLLGALFDLKEGKLVTVATDGKKLGYVSQEPTEITGEQDGQAIIPHKLLAEVQKLLTDEGEIKITLGQRQVSFDLDHTIFIGNKIEGAYPNYEMVIPKQFEYKVTLDRAEAMSVVRRASIISDEKNNSVILKFKGGEVEITAMTYDRGSFAGSMAVVAPANMDFEIVFNHRYLQDVMKVIDSEKVDLCLNKATSPAVLTPHDEDSMLFVVMPIKLNDLAQSPAYEE